MPKVYLDTGRKSESIRYDTIEISGKFVQVYDDLDKLLYRVKSGCAIHLMFWAAKNMGSYNQIILNKQGRTDFISTCISNGGNRYSDSAVKAAIALLSKNKIMISMSERGKRSSTYFVNPYHFWKTGSQKERTESIKGYIYKLEENERN